MKHVWSIKQVKSETGGYGSGTKVYVYQLMRDDTPVAISGFSYILEQIVERMNEVDS